MVLSVLHSVTALNLMALATLLLAVALGLRAEPRKDRIFWLSLVAALVGPMLWVLASFTPVWRTDFGATLWVTIAVTMVIYLLTVMVEEDSWRLILILSPAMLVLGILAVIWTSKVGPKLLSQEPGTLVTVHIIASVVTYGLVTIAAVAAFAALLRERALKTKRPTAIVRALPAVTTCDRQVVRVLFMSEVVLGTGLLSGVALDFIATGNLLTFDHKNIFTVTAFILIGILLLVHFNSGVKGRKAARWVLAAYLLLTLGYPGVKFVNEVLIGSSV